MWLLDNRTPYAAERTWAIDKQGAKQWVVAVRGTFDIAKDGATTLAEEQEPPRMVPLDAGEPGKSHVVYDIDLTGTKPATDVVLNATAHAPGGKSVTELLVSMTVGPLKKELLVIGDRTWNAGVMGASWSSVRPFVSMPLTWERAFGGMDQLDPDRTRHGYEPRNPIGVSYATDAKHLHGKPLPNVEYRNDRVSSWKDRPRPGGFGTVASYWSPRREWAGTYDDKWQKERFPLWPEDFDVRFFQCSPEDQQVKGHLRGGEHVELVNLSERGPIAFTLPKVYLGFTTFFGREREEHRGTLHTVIIEPSFPRVILVWHTSLSCHSRMERLERTVVHEKEILE